MTKVVRSRLLTFIASLIIVPVGTVFAIMFARGYRPDLQNRQITVTGILSAHSYPENAQITLNSEFVSSVTNTSLNLPPGRYSVELRKEGYFTWKKDLEIAKEVVTQATAVLFPIVPTFKPINYQYASKVTSAPNGSQIIYLSETNQVFSLDLSESALGTLNRDTRLLGKLPAGLSHSDLEITWSPDSQLALIINTSMPRNSTSSAYLVDPGSQKITSAIDTSTYLLQDWQERRLIRHTQMLDTLPPALNSLLATTSANLVWSPRENKLLYTATASAIMPDRIKKPLPGSSTQTQNRKLQPGLVYVYDIEEDRNFQIDEIVSTPTPKNTRTKTPVTTPVQTSLPNNGWSWFPTSSHLYRVINNEVIIIEYDGRNQTTVYAGPLSENTAVPYPSGKLMLILAQFETTPSASASADPSLYALTLR